MKTIDIPLSIGGTLSVASPLLNELQDQRNYIHNKFGPNHPAYVEVNKKFLLEAQRIGAEVNELIRDEGGNIPPGVQERLAYQVYTPSGSNIFTKSSGKFDAKQQANLEASIDPATGDLKSGFQSPMSSLNAINIAQSLGETAMESPILTGTGATLTGIATDRIIGSRGGLAPNPNLTQDAGFSQRLNFDNYSRQPMRTPGKFMPRLPYTYDPPQSGLPNLTQSNYSKVLGNVEIPQKTPMPEDIGLTGMSDRQKMQFIEQYEKLDDLGKKSVILSGQYPDLVPDIYNQDAANGRVKRTLNLDGNTLTASQQAQLKPGSAIQNAIGGNKYSDLAKQEAERVRKSYPKRVKSGQFETPEKQSKTIIKRALPVVGGTVLGGIGVSNVVSATKDAQGREQYEALQNMVKNGAKLPNGKRVYTDQEVEEFLKIYKELKDKGMIQ